MYLPNTVGYYKYLFIIITKGDGVAERSEASVATQPWPDRFPATGVIFLRANHGVRRTSAAIPHPGMAPWQIPTGYGWPNRKFCQKHTRVKNLQYHRLMT